MLIRQMKLEDVINIEQLMDQLGYPSTNAQLQSRFNQLLSLNDYQTYVAEYNANIVGFIGMAKQYAYEFDGPYLRILALVVDENIRRQNIGQKLMDAAESWGRENDCVAATLNSGNRPERIGAHRFYEALGYAGKSTGFSKKLTK